MDETKKTFIHRNTRPHSLPRRLGKHVANILVSLVVIELGISESPDVEIEERILECFNQIMRRLFPNEDTENRILRKNELKSHLKHDAAWNILAMSGTIGKNGFTPNSFNGITDYMRLKGTYLRTLIIMVLFTEHTEVEIIDKFVEGLAAEVNLDRALKTLQKHASGHDYKRSSTSAIAAFGSLTLKEKKLARTIIQDSGLLSGMLHLTIEADTTEDLRCTVADEIPNFDCSYEVVVRNDEETTTDDVNTAEACAAIEDDHTDDEVPTSDQGIKTRGKRCPIDYYGEWDFS